MSKIAKAIIWIVIIVIVVVAIWYGVSQRPAVAPGPAEKQAVKIGAILPLTGGSANLGEGVQRAMLLAKKQLQNTKYDYQIIFEDDAMERGKTANAVNKLISIDKADAVVSFTSGSGNVVSPIAEQNKVIHFGVASDPNVAQGNLNFIHWTPPQSQNKKFVEQLKKRNISKIAIIGLNQEGFIATLNDLKPRLEEANIKIVYEALISPEQRDFKTELGKAKEINPDTIYMGAFSPQLEILGKQYKELNINIPPTSIEAFEYSEQPELFEGYWYIQAADPTEKFVVQDYQGEYGEPPKLGSANGYDIVNLLVTAFENAGKNLTTKPSSEAVVAALYQIQDFPGALGKLSVPDTGIVWSEASVRMIKDGKPVTITE